MQRPLLNEGAGNVGTDGEDRHEVAVAAARLDSFCCSMVETLLLPPCTLPLFREAASV